MKWEIPNSSSFIPKCLRKVLIMSPKEYDIQSYFIVMFYFYFYNSFWPLGLATRPTNLRGLPSEVCAGGAQTHTLTLDIYGQAREYVAEKK